VTMRKSVQEISSFKRGDIVYYKMREHRAWVGILQSRRMVVNQGGKKETELVVKWLRGEGWIALDLLLQDMKLNKLTLRKL